MLHISVSKPLMYYIELKWKHKNVNCILGYYSMDLKNKIVNYGMMYARVNL